MADASDAHVPHSDPFLPPSPPAETAMTDGEAQSRFFELLSQPNGEQQGWMLRCLRKPIRCTRMKLKEILGPERSYDTLTKLENKGSGLLTSSEIQRLEAAVKAWKVPWKEVLGAIMDDEQRIEDAYPSRSVTTDAEPPAAVPEIVPVMMPAMTPERAKAMLEKAKKERGPKERSIAYLPVIEAYKELRDLDAILSVTNDCKLEYHFRKYQEGAYPGVRDMPDVVGVAKKAIADLIAQDESLLRAKVDECLACIRLEEGLMTKVTLSDLDKLCVFAGRQDVLLEVGDAFMDAGFKAAEYNQWLQRAQCMFEAFDAHDRLATLAAGWKKKELESSTTFGHLPELLELLEKVGDFVGAKELGDRLLADIPSGVSVLSSSELAVPLRDIRDVVIEAYMRAHAYDILNRVGDDALRMDNIELAERIFRGMGSLERLSDVGERYRVLGHHADALRLFLEAKDVQRMREMAMSYCSAGKFGMAEQVFGSAGVTQWKLENLTWEQVQAANEGDQ